jgi:hypothetical protein
MTTWELFRLLRGKAAWNWPDRAICDLLYRTGRISPYPAHYVPVGKVAKYWPEHGVVSIDIEGEHPLRPGERIGFLLSTKFHEEQVISLEVDRQAVGEALPGQRAGHKTKLGKDEVSVGTQVFLVGQ